MLIVHIGSMNPNKVAAVTRGFHEWGMKAGARFIGHDVPSGTDDQPQTFEATLAGARHRAENALRAGEGIGGAVPGRTHLGIGLESGLIATPGTVTGRMDVAVCAIYRPGRADRQEWVYGLSYGFESPKDVDALMSKGLTMSEAAFKAGYTTNRDIGSSEGFIGVLSKGRMDRIDQLLSAVRTALIHL